MMITPLGIYRLVFLLEIIILEFFLSFQFEKRKHFSYRVLIYIVLIFTVTFFLPLGNFTWYSTSLIFFFLYLLSLTGMLFCYKEKLINLFFVSLIAYCFQHISHQIIMIVSPFYETMFQDFNRFFLNIYSSNYVETDPYVIGVSVFLYVVVTAFCYFYCIYFYRRILKDRKIGIENLSLFSISFVIFFVAILFNSIITYEQLDNFSLLTNEITSLLILFCLIVSLILQFEALGRRSLAYQLDETNKIMREQKKQYEQSKTNIELINEKVHDLKHQIRAISQNKGLKEEAVSEIESIIKVYDNKFQTGNDVLDTILTEKSFVCQKKRIQMKVMIDGKSLSFIKPLSLYSLFGNILDNAIEATSQCEEGNRYISLFSKKKGNLLQVSAINSYVIDPKIDDGIIITSKQDHDYHGFGLKSIKSIVEQNGGYLNISFENHEFKLSMLFERP